MKFVGYLPGFVGLHDERQKCSKNTLLKQQKIKTPKSGSILRRSAAILLVAFTLNASATSYYVDSSAGNDSNNGLTSATPWKTLSKANAHSFFPGDALLLKKGGFWNEGLKITNSGITICSYGTGADPVLSGSIPIPPSAWKLYGGNIYVATVGQITPPTQLYVDDVYYGLARYPNSGYRKITANSSNPNTFIDSDLTLSADHLIGAWILARSNNWSIDSLPISGYSNYTITTSSALLHRNMSKNWGYVLRNKLWMLDIPKEWYYNSVEGKLYLWTAMGDSPANHIVEVSQIEHVVESLGNSNITIQDIAVKRANQNNIHLADGDSILVKNVSLSGGNLGLYLRASNSEVRDSSVEDTLWEGMHITGNSILIFNNRINNAGNMDFPVMVFRPEWYESRPGVRPFGGVGLRLLGSNNTVSSNIITNSGYDGILFNGRTLVEKNTIDRAALRLQDGGGIYFWAPFSKNSIVQNNTVSHVMGNSDGTPNSNLFAVGIYLDGSGNTSNNIVVSHNTVDTTIHGIFIHNGYTYTITANRVRNTVNGLRVSHDAVQTGGVRDIGLDDLVFGNVFATMPGISSAEQEASIWMRNTVRPLSNYGTFNNNLYCHSSEGDVSFTKDPTASIHHTLSAWQLATGQDTESIDIVGDCSSASRLPITPTVKITVVQNNPPSLQWSTYNAQSCTASGGWSGTKLLSGKETVNNPSENQFTLSCTNGEGTTSKTVHVDIPLPIACNRSLYYGAAWIPSSTLSACQAHK